MASPVKLGEVVKNVPNALYWVVGVCFVAILAAFVILSATGSSTDDLTKFLNTVLNIASALLGGGGLLFGAAAARSAHQAAEQTDGKLDDRIEQAVSRAVTPDEPVK